MAINSPLAPNQTGSTAQQPSSALSASGLGSAASPTQTPGLGSGSLGQSPISLGDLPQLQPYTSSLPYLAALEQQPQLTIPDLGDPVLASIQQKLLAGQQSNPLLNGTQLPHPGSKLASTQSGMSPLDIIKAAGQGIWTQEVVNPVQDYIHTWQTNPGQAFLETLGGVAITAGLVGLEVVTGGAATPFIFAGLAALEAPNLINSWSQEALHPSDANLVRAMVSTGAGALAVGSPIRAFKGIKTARNLLESQIQARKSLSSVGDAADLLIGRRGAGEGVAGLPTGASLVQLGTLDVNNVEVLREQLLRRGSDLEDTPAKTLMLHSEAVSKLRDDIEQAYSVGDSETALKKLGELKDYAVNEMRDDFLRTAYNYVYLPTTPYSHVPLGSIQGVEADLQSTLNQHTNAISGLFRRMHLGIGLHSVSDMAHQDIASIKEAEAYDQAAGTSFDSVNRILSSLKEMQRVAGVEGTSEVFTATSAQEWLAGKSGVLRGWRGSRTGSLGAGGVTYVASTRGYAENFGNVQPVEAQVGKPYLLHQGDNAERLVDAEIAAGQMPADQRDYFIEQAKRAAPAALSQEAADWLRGQGYDAIIGQGDDLGGGTRSAPIAILLDPDKIEMGARGDQIDAHEAINQALEEPEKWAQLNPAQQAYAQKLRDISDFMTTGDLRYGTISHPLQGTMHRYFTGVAAETGKEQQGLEQAAKRTYTSSWLERPVGVRSDLWKAAVDDETYAVGYRAKTRAEIIKDQEEQARRYEETHKHRQIYAENEKQFQTWNRSLGQLKRHKNDAGITALEDKVRNSFGGVGVELLHMSRSELNKVLNAAPKSEELVTGFDSVKRAITNHVFRAQRAAFGEALQVHSNMGLDKLKGIFGNTKVEHWGARMSLPEFKEASDFPDVLPETVFESAKNVEEAAQRLGYFKVHPATGASHELNYRPALYARDKIANEVAAAMEKTTSSEQQSGLVNALYKVSAGTKRFIMYNPVYHFLNVAGRAIAFIGSDPVMAGTALKATLQNPWKAVQTLHGDAAAHADLLEEASMSGMVPATQWNVAEHLRVLQREEDGQPSFFGAVRNFGRALDNVHRDVAEKGLWSAVDQLQLAGYVYSKQRFLNRGIKEFEARRLASTYANNLGGMVNPLYMSTLWRHMKGLVFFAPSYWSTFLHSVQSVIPGNARLSHAMANVAGGKLIGLTTTPLRTMDYRHRIELSRAQRDWMITYLATTAVVMDMMNVMFSGHHLWENEQGHEWNIDMTNVAGTQTSPSGEVKRAYITAAPFFRQGVDIGNAIGLGHDWGFGHVFGDKTWQQQDALHKTELAAGALLDGVRRTGSTKLGIVPQTGGNLALGRDVSSLLGTGTQVKVDRPAALLTLLPNGYQLQRLYKTYQQASQQYKPGTPQYQQAQQQWQQVQKDMLPNAIQYLTGFPSVYHMGVERPPIDDSKFENWVIQRDAGHSRLKQYSDEVFQGKLTPLEYARHKHEEQIKENQLNTDTWGTNSPGSGLGSAYQQLATQFGLDNPGLSTQDWFERYDAFLPAWSQILQSASPSTRAAWWEHSTMQWTDADYLEWEAKQLRDSLAASIDGQGGNHIRAVQNQLFRLKPTLTVAEYQKLQQSDPYYLAYTTLLKEMGKTSALGAFVSAFSSPYSQTYVSPAGLAPEEAARLAEHTGHVVIRPETAQQLATGAKQIAREPGVAQAGGQPEESAAFRQQEQEAIAAAQSGISQGQ